jgi:hypothetical protein
MNVLILAILVTTFLVSVLKGTGFILFYFGIVGIYALVYYTIPENKYNTAMRKLRICTWDGWRST